jgi:hypothetical protein
MAHLECGFQAWRPYLRIEIDLLKGVQTRAAKVTTLDTRRLGGSD